VPGLATTYYCDDPELAEAVLPFVDYLEIAPDAIASFDGDRPYLRPNVVAHLREISCHVGLIVHGVGLSIGSHDSWNSDYLALLDQLYAEVPVEWHSEHLGYTTVCGQFLGTMLPLPRTEQALELVAERAAKILDRYGKPFLLEHVVGLLPDAPNAFTDAEFANLIADWSGCGLIIDAYNLWCDKVNRGLDIGGFVAELDPRHVMELHIAGGTTHKGLALDVHSRVAAAETVELANDVLAGQPNIRAVTYELLQEAVPVLGARQITRELERLSTALHIRSAMP
jgi:uncharacterized protein (UPF0276 family)